LLQSHNVYQHIYAVQEANRRYEQGIMPSMIMQKNNNTTFRDVVNEVFSQKTRQDSHRVIEQYDRLWMQMQSGSQGMSGKKTVNALTKFNELFSFA
jgi:DNA-binding cell septation regulator SpoVG